MSVAGGKGEDAVPNEAEFRFPVTGQCTPRSLPGFLAMVVDLLQGMRLSVDQARKPDDHIVFRTSYAERGDLLREDDEKNHIGARRVAYLVDVAPRDTQTQAVTVTIKAILEYRKIIESTWRRENGDAIYSAQLTPILEKIRALQTAQD